MHCCSALDPADGIASEGNGGGNGFADEDSDGGGALPCVCGDLKVLVLPPSAFASVAAATSASLSLRTSLLRLLCNLRFSHVSCS